MLSPVFPQMIEWPQMYLASLNCMPVKGIRKRKWAPEVDGRGLKQTRSMTFQALIFLLEGRTDNDMRVEACKTTHLPEFKCRPPERAWNALYGSFFVNHNRK